MIALVSLCMFAVSQSLHSSHTQYEPPHDKTNKMTVRPAKTQISLGIRPVWSEPSLCTQWVAKDPSYLHADSEYSDQTERIPRLIWVFAWRTCHFVGFVMRRLIYGNKKTPHLGKILFLMRRFMYGSVIPACRFIPRYSAHNSSNFLGLHILSYIS